MKKLKYIKEFSKDILNHNHLSGKSVRKMTSEIRIGKSELDA